MNDFQESLPTRLSNTSKSEPVKKETQTLNIKLTSYEPSKPKIATMTLVSRISANVNLSNFSKCVTLSDNNILGVKYAKGTEYVDRALDILNSSKKKKKKKKVFYNQCTLIIECDNKCGCVSDCLCDKYKRVNLKLFLNGKIQMTGCKSIEHAKCAIDKLSVELKKEKYSLNEITGKFIKKDIIDNLDFEMTEPRIELINSVFHTGLNINREYLHTTLVNKYNIYATFQPCIYVGINSKFISSTNIKVTVLIFQTGKIIITGAKTLQDIDESYIFINKVLLENLNDLQQL